MSTFFNDNSQAVKQKNTQNQEMGRMRSDIQNLQQAVKMLADEGAKELEDVAEIIAELRDQNKSLSKDIGNLTTTLYTISVIVRTLVFVSVGTVCGLIASFIF